MLQPEQSAHRISQVADEGREAKGRGMIGAQEDRVEGDRRDTVDNSCHENAKSYVFVAIVHHRDWYYSTLSTVCSSSFRWQQEDIFPTALPKPQDIARPQLHIPPPLHLLPIDFRPICTIQINHIRLDLPLPLSPLILPL